LEKAFTTTVEQAQELAAIAKENVKLSVFQNRWDSDLKPYKKIISDEVLAIWKPNSILIATIRF
jgi:predicted dehydrogenase